MTMDELKAKAGELLEADFVWFDTEKRELSIGIDWDGPYLVVVDLEHPDGPAIESAGLIDLNTIYTSKES
jgi:hypothetical protein